MTPLLRKLLGMNWLLFAAVVMIALAGILFIHGASYMHPAARYWQQQAMFVGFGLVIFFVVTLIDFRWVKWLAVPMYLASIALVALTYTKFGVVVNNAKCWLHLPGLPTFQPGQIAAVGGILCIALFLSYARRWHPALRIVCSGIIAAPAMVLILNQPDLGMTIAWVPVILTMLFLCGMPLRWLAVVLLAGLTLLPLVMNFKLKPYQRDRVVTFLDPDVDPRGIGYGVNQSLTAIGSAGIRGKGFKAPDTQLELGMIPKAEEHTDYIFATIGEQWGFLGGTALIATFGVLIIACMATAVRATDQFGLLIVGGITAQLFFHVFQNIGMTIALMPITGLPLPLISYGGTFALVLMFNFGLVNSVWVHSRSEEEGTEEE
jgi:rod shape determining protein RodA